MRKIRRQTNPYATIPAPIHHNLPVSSFFILTETEWLESVKKKTHTHTQLGGQNSETRAENTLHVDAVFELTMIPGSH